MLSPSYYFSQSKSVYPRWVRLTAAFLAGIYLQFLGQFGELNGLVSRVNAADMPPMVCANLPTPLTPVEETYARGAWDYFIKNTQGKTGFANSTHNYPSGTLWDLGNYLMAMHAARGLKIIEKKEFDERLNKFLTTISKVKLFDDVLPNKVYHGVTTEMVDYGNNSQPRGIGWSALDIGRILVVFHVLRTCYPEYKDWLNGVISRWKLEKSIREEQLFGALVKPDKTTLLVQEGRLGYEEYAVRGYQLWGYKAAKALDFQPFKFVNIYGIEIPVDIRDYHSTNANNYVVSESYILDGIEFGFKGELSDYAGRILEVQKRRYEATGQLTAVSEDNVNGAPYFIYNTIYANGVPWAAITEDNKLHPDRRSISTKAAFGWRYLYPTNVYAQKVFDVVKDLRDPEKRGYFAGVYEESKKTNVSLTGNTNGLILEIMYYKATGNQPLVSPSLQSATSTPTPPPPPNATLPLPPPAETVKPGATLPPANVAANPTSPPDRRSSCPTLPQPLSLPEKRYAAAAWRFFATNTEANGLVNDRYQLRGVTLWGMGDYLAALQSAIVLGVISPAEFHVRAENLLNTLARLPLFAGELPNRGYNSWSLQPVDYGNNPSDVGTGWSSLDVGRLLASLYSLKSCYPAYSQKIDRLLLDWSYLRIIRDGELFSAATTTDTSGRIVTRIEPETRLGFEEYAARGFQLWGFDTQISASGGKYQTLPLEGVEVPVRRLRSNRRNADNLDNHFTVSDPFLLYGLEFGFDPSTRTLVEPLFKAEAARYQQTKHLTTTTQVAIDTPPYRIRNTAFGNGVAWETLGNDGKSLPELRAISTAAAFSYIALFPNEPYAVELWRAMLDLYNPSLGYYEGIYERTGTTISTFSSSTNSIVLESLLYRAIARQPLIFPDDNLQSPWWEAISRQEDGRGLPRQVGSATHLVNFATNTYWENGRISSRSTSDDRPSNNTILASAPELATRRQPPPTPTPTPTATPTPEAPPRFPSLNGEQPAADAPSLPPPPPPPPPTPTPPPTPVSRPTLNEADRRVAQKAWQFFDRNINPKTGLINITAGFYWTTWWDQGSAVLGMHAAKQLGLVSTERFDAYVKALINTLMTMSLPASKLPNKDYNTRTAQMRKINVPGDSTGTMGWSALDLSRFLMGLYVLKTNYPQYGTAIDLAVARWDANLLVKDGWLTGGKPIGRGQIERVQEGRFGYEQYAAHILKLWYKDAPKARWEPPIKTIKIDGISLKVDRRDLQNSGASNYLTNDPYILWGLELGWYDVIKPQVESLLQVQAQRFAKTGILTAVNEDSIDRPPYFLYYSVHSNGRSWEAIDPQEKPYPQLRFVSTKAAFGWQALKANNAYAQKLRAAVDNLANDTAGYFSGIYENRQLGVNKAIDLSTNAVILESLLYRFRGNRPMLNSPPP